MRSVRVFNEGETMKKKNLVMLVSAAALLGLAGCDGHNIGSDTSDGSSVSSVETVKYTVTDSTEDHIVIVGIPAEAEEGEKVSFTIAVEVAYEFKGEILVKDASGNVLDVANENGKYSFTMPASNVTIEGSSDVSSFAIDWNVDSKIGVKAFEKKPIASKADFCGDWSGIFTSTHGTSSTQYRTRFDLAINPDKATVTRYSDGDTEAERNYQYKIETSWSVEEDAEGVKHVTLAASTGNSNYPSFSIKAKFVENEDGTKTLVVEEMAEAARYSSDTPTYVLGAFNLVKAYDGTIEGDYYEELSTLPDVGEYGKVFYLLAENNDDYALDSLTMDGNSLTKNDDGYYEFSVGYHSISMKVTSKVRYTPITITNGEHITVKAYTASKNEENKTVYNEVTEAKHNDQIFYKVEEGEGYDESYALGNITVQYGEDDVFGIKSPSTYVLTKNSDGYYTNSSVSKMSDMDFGVKVTVDEFSAITKGNIFSGKTRTLSSSTEYDMTISKFGAVKVGSDEYYYKDADVDETAGTILFHKYGSADTILGAYSDGFYAIPNATMLANTNIGYVKGEGETVDIDYVVDNGTSANVTTALATITKDGTIKVVLFEKGEKGITTTFGVTTEILNGKETISTDGAIFDVKKGENVVATYKYNAGTKIISEFTKGAIGEFGNEDVKLVSNGVTLTSFGGEDIVKTVAFGENGETAFVTQKDSVTKLYVAKIDETAKTFASVDGKPYGIEISKVFNGISISTSGLSKQSYYTIAFGGKGSSATNPAYTAGDALACSWIGSAYTYDIGYDGTISTSNGYSLSFSEDGKSVMGVSGSYIYAFSSNITAYSYSAGQVSKANYGDKYVLNVSPSSSSNGTFDGNGFEYDPKANKAGWLSFADVTESKTWADNGASFKISKDGVELGSFINSNGTLVANISGTYKDSSGVEYVIDASACTITYGDKTYDYTIAEDNATLTYIGFVTSDSGTIITNGTLVVDSENLTATNTITSTKSFAFKVTNDNQHPWLFDSSTGSFTAPSGNDSTTVVLTITFVSKGTFGFDYNVSSESGYDTFTAKKDGIAISECSSLSGEQTGSITNIEVDANGTITFEYKKDSSQGKGRDNVIISNLLFTAAA